jgi:hypothetical protein
MEVSMSMKCLLLTVVLYAVCILPQNNNNFTGNLSVDSRLILNGYKDNVVKQNSFELKSDKKSVVLAGVLSGIIPGAGEVYVGGTTNYIKAGVFAIIEAISIYYTISYNKRGDAQTNFFQNFADQKWSVVRYAKWINDHSPTVKVTIYPADAQHPNPWEQVDWASLNAAEDAIGAIGFTHKLPPHGDQQYYELIGKYPQYARGWEDDDQLDNPDYITPQFHWYSEMRGDANALYRVSARGTAIRYINHVLSILDAIWSSVSFNKNIALNISYDRVNLAFVEDWTPTLHLKYNF